MLAVAAGVSVAYATLLAPALAMQVASDRDPGQAVIVVASQGNAVLDPADIDALTRALPGTRVGRALAPVSFSAAAAGASTPVTLESVDSAFFSVYGLQTANGTFFTPADDLRASPVAVLGQQVAQSEFGSATAATGKSLRVQNVSLTVVGVLAESSSPDMALFNQSVFVPLQTGRVRLVGTQAATELVIGAASETDASKLAVLASRVLALRYPSTTSAFSVQVHEENQVPASVGGLLLQAVGRVRAQFLEAKGLACTCQTLS
jgi:hypothetical protein